MKIIKVIAVTWQQQKLKNMKLSLLLFVIVLINNNGKLASGSRILGIFPLHGKSHFVMFEALMKGLARRGHQVDVVSHFPLKEPFPNYKDLSLEGTLPVKVNNMSYEDMKMLRNPLTMFKDVTKMAGDDLCELMGNPILQNIIKNPPSDPPYDLYITEICMSPCYLIFGRLLNVPMIGVSSLSWGREMMGNPVNTAYEPAPFVPYSQHMNFWGRLMNTILTNVVFSQINYFTSQQDKYIRKYVGPNWPSVKELEKDVDLLLVNSYFVLDGIKPNIPSVVEVGGLHVHTDEKLPSRVKKFLDDSKHGCVYVSFGSMVTIESFPEENILAMYSAFKNIAPVRVLMKISNKSKLPVGLPDNVMTEPWLPQVAVLKHENTRIFVTHGGLMSTQESVYSGVPMIGYPLFGDQFNNMNNYVRKKIAISLDHQNMSAEQLTNAINELLTNNVYRDNVKKLSKLYFDRPMSVMDTAIFWTEYVIRNGNVLRSPALDLTWWQLALLDVYAAITLAILLMLLIIRFALKKLYRCFYKSSSSKKKSSLRSKKNN